MATETRHYERAFEEFLRSRRIPYVRVEDARKALIPGAGPLSTPTDAANETAAPAASGRTLKSFDFVVYGSEGNLLIDVKGRKVATRTRPSRRTGLEQGRLESWATLDDLASLRVWKSLFGDDFDAALVFVYWCEAQPPDALFQEIMEFRGRWYAFRSISLDAYEANMKPRSARWRTVDVPRRVFERVSTAFAPPACDRSPAGHSAPAAALLPHRGALGSTA